VYHKGYDEQNQRRKNQIVMRPYNLYKIKGDFFDCQLYKGFLYLWDMDGVLCIYDWGAIKQTMALVPNATGMYGNIKAFKRFRKGSPVEVVGGMFPTDTAFIGGYLYTAVETGLYRGRAITDAYRQSRYFTSSRPQRVWECPPLSLTANYNGMQLAISTGEDGLFEINLSKYVKTNGLRKIQGDLYIVSSQKAIRSRYVKKGSIYSTDENLNKHFHEFILSRENNGSAVRTYIRDYDFGAIVDEKWSAIAGTESFSSISRITNKGVEVYPVYRSQRSLRSLPIMEMVGTKRKLVAVESVEVGIIIEYENGLQLRNRKGQVLIKINTPVTRWRWFNVGNKKLLVVVLEDYLEIYEL